MGILVSSTINPVDTAEFERYLNRLEGELKVKKEYFRFTFRIGDSAENSANRVLRSLRAYAVVSRDKVGDPIQGCRERNKEVTICSHKYLARNARFACTSDIAVLFHQLGTDFTQHEVQLSEVAKLYGKQVYYAVGHHLIPPERLLSCG